MSAEPLKKKVLHIIDGFGTGGAETWLLACVKYLHQHQELGLHFDFLASGGKKGVFDDEVIGYGATVFYQKYSLKNFIGFRKQFKKILNQNDYVAIHDHQDFISGWHFLAGSGSLPVQRIAHWKSLLIARAIENQCFVIGVNRVGQDQNGYFYPGNSMIVDFNGDVICEMNDSESISSSVIDKAEMLAFRSKLPFYKDRIV